MHIYIKTSPLDMYSLHSKLNALIAFEFCPEINALHVNDNESVNPRSNPLHTAGTQRSIGLILLSLSQWWRMVVLEFRMLVEAARSFILLVSWELC